MIPTNYKKAVLISGHLRSFYLNWENKLQFFGENTDFFFTLWDEDYYANREDPEYREVYLPFDKDKFVDYLSTYSQVKSIKFISRDDFFEWCKLLVNTTTNNELKLMLYGQIYNCYKNVEFHKDLLYNYDIIFRDRPDNQLFLRENSIELFTKQINEDINCFYTNKNQFRSGSYRLGDSFFYTSPRTYISYFENLADKLNSIYSNPFFKEQELSLTNHKLWGALAMFSNLNRVRDSVFKRVIVRM